MSSDPIEWPLRIPNPLPVERVPRGRKSGNDKQRQQTPVPEDEAPASGKQAPPPDDKAPPPPSGAGGELDIWV